MIIQSENLVIEQRTGERAGTLSHILTSAQMHHKNNLFAKITLKPGAKVPYHAHNGDFEIYYILSGQALVNDNTTIKEAKAGDIIFTDHSESHSIENIGDTDLEFLALITLL